MKNSQFFRMNKKKIEKVKIGKFLLTCFAVAGAVRALSLVNKITLKSIFFKEYIANTTSSLIAAETAKIIVMTLKRCLV